MSIHNDCLDSEYCFFVMLFFHELFRHEPYAATHRVKVFEGFCIANKRAYKPNSVAFCDAFDLRHNIIKFFSYLFVFAGDKMVYGLRISFAKNT
jgi:hypothetical protein